MWYAAQARQAASTITPADDHARWQLEDAITWLYDEIASPQLFTEPTGALRTDFRAWQHYARGQERAGRVDRSIDAWKRSAAVLQSSSLTSSQKSVLLLAPIEQLTRMGAFEVASQVAASIEGDEATRAYATFLVVNAHATKYNFQEAATVARTIQVPNTRAAAFWLIALEQAEAGQRTDAEKSVEQALQATELPDEPDEELAEQDLTVLEFGVTGQTTVPLCGYKSLALARLATEYILASDEELAESTLKRIEAPLLRGAATADVAYSLLERDRPDLASVWLSRVEVPELQTAAALQSATYCVEHHTWRPMIQFMKRISNPMTMVIFRLDFAKELTKDENPQIALEQINFARDIVQRISDPHDQSLAYAKMAEVNAQMNRRSEAIENLKAARQAVARDTSNPKKSLAALNDVVVTYRQLGATSEVDATMKLARSVIEQLDAESRSALLHNWVMTQAKHGIDEATLQLARSIPDPRRRAEALTAAASYYAERGARDTSRSIFREAYAVAKEVGRNPDYESWNSSSDATRRVARAQAQHDLEGLIAYADRSTDAAVRAAANLGIAEALAPEAAERASLQGTVYPQGVFDSLWSQRVISRVMNRSVLSE
jgi:tetratricopeptide (TPR) repeat protein